MLPSAVAGPANHDDSRIVDSHDANTSGRVLLRYPKGFGGRSGGVSFLHLLATLFVVWVAGGAACSRQQRIQDFQPPPVVFESVPTLEGLAEMVNRTDEIRKLQSNSTTVTAPDFSGKGLSSTLILERDKHFRLRGKLSPLPTVLVDLGSNDEVFWFQTPDGMQKILYYAEHEAYAKQTERMVLPVDPTWLIDALGLVHLDPATVTEGPTRRPDGKLEVRSQIAMAGGNYRRLYVIDDKTAVVTEQYLYDTSDRLVARAIASDHRFYQEVQCSMPHRIDIHLQPDVGPPMALEIEVGTYSINQILSGDPQLFTMPTGASKKINLATMGGVAFGVPPGVSDANSPYAGVSNGGNPAPAQTAPLSTAWPGGAVSEGESSGTAVESGSTLKLPPETAGGPAQYTAEAQYAPATDYNPTLRGTFMR